MDIEKIIDEIDIVLKKNGLGIDEYMLGDKSNVLYLTIGLILKKPQRERGYRTL